MMDRMNAAFKNEKQFIANVSHELLTPVSLLKNRFENLIQDETLGDAAVDKIAASLRTLDRLQKIINNLLLISKIENNQFHASETIDITEMLEELVEEIDDRLVEKEIRLRFDMLEKFIFIGNATLLHILLYNLIANAIKYNKQNGEIRISDSYRGANYVLSIADTGIGMDAARLTDIFKRFTRLRLEGDGQGLGLAIVKSIADFHKIRIEVTSVQEKSSTFNLIFPSKN
jgi:signal transduction histidine kinase